MGKITYLVPLDADQIDYIKDAFSQSLAQVPLDKNWTDVRKSIESIIIAMQKAKRVQ